MISSSLSATAAKRWWKRNQLALLVERHDEQVGALQVVEDRRGVVMPTTWSHSGAENRSRIETVVMKSRTRSVCRLSTSSVR